MEITIDRDVCVGAASCVGVAPGVFVLDEDYKSTVIDPNGADADTIRKAAEMCPTGAIKLSE